MGQSIFDYAAANPMQEPPQLTGPPKREETAAAAEAVQERQQDQEQAEQLKRSILTQLEKGNAPQIILYTALKCIGLYTNDPEYIKAGAGYLDSVYDDLLQLSMLQDNAQIAAERLQTQKIEYIRHLRNSLDRQLSGCRKIEKALTNALNEVNSIDDPAELPF